MNSGLYLVTLMNEELISVNAHDARIAHLCIGVNRLNCKLGKARNLGTRARNYAKTFGSHNVDFRPIALMDDVETAEHVILRALAAWRLRSHRGRHTEWLRGIAPREAERIALHALVEAGIEFRVPDVG
jgi:hypothetical protein